MNNFDEFMGMEGKREQVKQEYDKTSKEKWNEFKEKFNNYVDWFKIPLNILFVFILGVGAILMYFSILHLTNNVFIAILSPSFAELGILAWKISKERPKNTHRQTEIEKWARNLHVFATVILLMLNFVIESA